MNSLAPIGATTILLVFLSIHFCVLFKLLPYSIVWGGRINSQKEMYPKQVISIAMTCTFLWIIIEKTRIVKGILSESALNILIWLMIVVFIFGTLGNLFSKNPVEKYLFSTLSILLTICCLFMVL